MKTKQRPPWKPLPPECELITRVGDSTPSEVICTYYEENALGEKRFMGTKIGKIIFE